MSFLVIMTCQKLYVTLDVVVTVVTDQTIHVTLCEKVEIAGVHTGYLVWLQSNLLLWVFTFVDISLIDTEQDF